MSYSTAALNGFGDTIDDSIDSDVETYNSAALNGFGERTYNSAALDGFGERSYNSAALDGFGRPKLKKGSPQAKAYMAYLRSLRTGKRSTKKLKGKGLGKLAILGMLAGLLLKKKKGGFKIPPETLTKYQPRPGIYHSIDPLRGPFWDMGPRIQHVTPPHLRLDGYEKLQRHLDSLNDPKNRE